MGAAAVAGSEELEVAAPVLQGVLEAESAHLPVRRHEDLAAAEGRAVGAQAEALLAAVGRFHAILHRVGGSPRLRAVLHSLSGIVPGNFFAVIPGSIEVARDAFPEIAAAIRAGDPEQAARRCRAMHRAQGQRVVAYLRACGLF